MRFWLEAAQTIISSSQSVKMIFQFLKQVNHPGSVTEITRGMAGRHRLHLGGDVKHVLNERIPEGTFSVKFWGVRGLDLPTPGAATLQYGGNTSCIRSAG